MHGVEQVARLPHRENVQPLGRRPAYRWRTGDPDRNGTPGRRLGRRAQAFETDATVRSQPRVQQVASDLAAEIYDLDILHRNMEDHTHNTTRFIIMAREPKDPDPNSGPIMTSFVFQVRNVPAALYKAMGGFATNGVNMTKLESYMVNGEFSATQFYADIEGHPSQTNVRLALEELGFFSRAVKVLGVYPANRAGIDD